MSCDSLSPAFAPAMSVTDLLQSTCCDFAVHRQSECTMTQMHDTVCNNHDTAAARVVNVVDALQLAAQMAKVNLDPYLDSAQRICAQTNFLAIKHIFHGTTVSHPSRKSPTSAMYCVRSSQNGVWLLSSKRTHFVRGMRWKSGARTKSCAGSYRPLMTRHGTAILCSCSTMSQSFSSPAKLAGRQSKYFAEETKARRTTRGRRAGRRATGRASTGTRPAAGRAGTRARRS
jgi:hypothetical protein